MKSERLRSLGRGLLYNGIRYSGLGALYKLLLGTKSGTLSYHNILPDDHLTSHRVNAVDVSVSSFEGQLRYLSERGLIRSATSAIDDEGTGFLLTFDDGMLNNYEIVAPILRKFSVTAIFAVCPGLISGAIPYIWRDHTYLILRRMVGRSVRLPLEEYREPLLVSEGNIDEIAERFRDWTLRSRHQDVYETVKQICEANGIAYERSEYMPLRFHPMSAGQIEELALEGHVIASHTWSHRILSSLSSSERDRELRSSKEYLEALLNTSIDCIVYPYGGENEVDAKTVQAAMAAGYHTGFMNVAEPSLNPASLARPRFSLPDTSSAAHIDARLFGLQRHLKRLI